MKQKRGRPKIMRHVIRRNIQLEKSDNEKLKKLLRSEGISLAAFVRTAVMHKLYQGQLDEKIHDEPQRVPTWATT